MVQSVLYFAESADTSDGWQRRLGEHNYQVLRTTSADRLLHYARSHPAVGVIIEAGMKESSPESLASVVRQLREEPGTASVPIIAMFAGIEGLDRLAPLAEAGISGIYLRGMPERFLLHYFEASHALQQLQSYAATGMDVRKLAAETRQRIHDLSQPLAALQGRLQILHSKTPAEDPLKERVDLMVKLVMEVSAHLRELQELQRKYS